MMFKILILQRLYNISDAQAEYRIKDRLSFTRFPGLALCDTVPDEKMIWEYREHLVQAKVIDTIFYQFARQLEEKKVITYSGSIIDAAFAGVPRQRNSRSENKTIKENKIVVINENLEITYTTHDNNRNDIYKYLKRTQKIDNDLLNSFKENNKQMKLEKILCLILILYGGMNRIGLTIR
jgi:IS5 family transposase